MFSWLKLTEIQCSFKQKTDIVGSYLWACYQQIWTSMDAEPVPQRISQMRLEATSRSRWSLLVASSRYSKAGRRSPNTSSQWHSLKLLARTGSGFQLRLWRLPTRLRGHDASKYVLQHRGFHSWVSVSMGVLECILQTPQAHCTICCCCSHTCLCPAVTDNMLLNIFCGFSYCMQMSGCFIKTIYMTLQFKKFSKNILHSLLNLSDFKLELT